MKTYLLTIITLLGIQQAIAQQENYAAAIASYQKKYVDSHEVVKGRDRRLISFYPVDAGYNVTARFEKNMDTTTIAMKTSGTSIPVKNFTRYGKLFFKISDTALVLTVYRSTATMPADYKDYLFIPFTDMTSGSGSYGGGRYVDISTTDIKDGWVQLDFNKAYNPYCAYTTGYNCPIPPRENYLQIFLRAGEKDYGKKH